MNNIENTASNLGDKLVHTANNVADEIKNAAQATVDSAKQTLHNQTLTEDVSQYMHKGMDAAHDMGNQIKSSAVKCANGCGHYISEKPMKSVAIAVGLGALLSLVLFNKKH